MTPTPSPEPVMPLLEVVTQMYRMARVLKHEGQGLSGSQQAEGLHIVNSLLDGIKTERWFFYQILRTIFPVSAGQKDYTVGDAGLGADWVVERPSKLLSAGVLVPGTPPGNQSEIETFVARSYEQYQAIVTKDSPSTFPLVVYYQAALPLGIATLWPVPSADNPGQIVLYTPQTVQEFSDINGDFIVPKGYREFLEYAGAVGVHNRHPENPLDPDVRIKAIEYKSRVAASQSTPAYMRSDDAVLKPGINNALFAFNGRTLIG